MMKGSLHRLLHAVHLAAASAVLLACSGGETLENSAQQSGDINAGAPSQFAMQPDAFANSEMVPSTRVELQHFDAYLYYRSVFDLHADAGASAGNGGGRSLLSCLRSYAFK